MTISAGFMKQAIFYPRRAEERKELLSNLKIFKAKPDMLGVLLDAARHLKDEEPRAAVLNTLLTIYNECKKSREILTQGEIADSARRSVSYAMESNYPLVKHNAFIAMNALVPDWKNISDGEARRIFETALENIPQLGSDSAGTKAAGITIFTGILSAKPNIEILGDYQDYVLEYLNSKSELVVSHALDFASAYVLIGNTLHEEHAQKIASLAKHHSDGYISGEAKALLDLIQ